MRRGGRGLPNGRGTAVFRGPEHLCVAVCWWDGFGFSCPSATGQLQPSDDWRLDMSRGLATGRLRRTRAAGTCRMRTHQRMAMATAPRVPATATSGRPRPSATPGSKTRTSRCAQRTTIVFVRWMACVLRSRHGAAAVPTSDLAICRGNSIPDLLWCCVTNRAASCDRLDHFLIPWKGPDARCGGV